MQYIRKEHLRIILLTAQEPLEDLNEFIDDEITTVKRTYFVILVVLCIGFLALIIRTQSQYEKDVVTMAKAMSDSLNENIQRNIDTVSVDVYDPADSIIN